MKLFCLRLQNPTLHYLVIPISNEDYSIGLDELRYYNVFNYMNIEYSRSKTVMRLRLYRYPKRLFPERFRFYPGFIVYDDIRNASFWSLSDLINSVTVTPSIISSLILKSEDCEFLGEIPDIDDFHEYFFKLLNRYQPAFNNRLYDSLSEDLIISWVRKYKLSEISRYISDNTIFPERMYEKLKKFIFKSSPKYCSL